MLDPLLVNPVLDVLLAGSFTELAAVLRGQADAIVPSWENMVREVLPAADALTISQLRDHIPMTLDRLADVLESTSIGTINQFILETGQHGNLRFEQGFNIDELLIEYRLLRRALIEHVESSLNRRTTIREDVALNMGIDIILHNGITAFVEHRTTDAAHDPIAAARVLSTLSHDLRNNISAVMLTLELLRRKLTTQPRLADDLSDLKVARQTLMETIEGIERLARGVRARER